MAISEAAAAVTTVLATALFSIGGCCFFMLQAIFSASYSRSPSSPSGRVGVDGEGGRFSPASSNGIKIRMKCGFKLLKDFEQFERVRFRI